MTYAGGSVGYLINDCDYSIFKSGYSSIDDAIYNVIHNRLYLPQSNRLTSSSIYTSISEKENN